MVQHCRAVALADDLATQLVASKWRFELKQSGLTRKWANCVSAGTELPIDSPYAASIDKFLIADNLFGCPIERLRMAEARNIGSLRRCDSFWASIGTVFCIARWTF
jgi:hypothetical protein